MNFLGIKSEYKWNLEEDYAIRIPELDGIALEIPYVSVKNGWLTIYRGYAWNGCTPYASIWDMFVIETPDGIIDYQTGKPKAYYASLVHDALYQYEIHDRKVADDLFYTMLKSARFFPAKIYHLAVRWFGRRW